MSPETGGTAHLTSAASMRVLAHPTRLRLLGLLRELGPQTAALLGDIVDEAPGTVSYHLAKLASIGLIQEAADVGTDRRERWWRSSHALTSWEPADLLGDPAALAASTALQRAIVQIYAANFTHYLDNVPALPVDWVRAAPSSDRGLRLTVAELAELRKDLEVITEKFLALSAAHTEADGSERVSLVYQAYRTP
ncbi:MULTISPECIES: helix-turn-helix domain-containing protein [unclassified Cryobacterium]|uniref:helix-turn-helix domain-containing protein n=1 Tax=unclassified Cryobacterium TaxID=2649013 RepID=UPI00106C05C7|nr:MULTISPECIES: helix-turn-helix domain-containing protein [unclassified Cryobacterium]MDY7528179.1 helix-turn-helix domain-containing protein [Cryobacterium sp. 10C2]MDY7556071.1 helix-turn-helix domain-containing protein [Cryobacterium sp. 10C3]MEB0001972.1 helix-turn-helix domain-containing protein [Cryobacterium sp. RTC2.1]MEB0200522.1 helix-turn-helix domain-containing protein [Cryobacterium sp. 5I3]MEB0285478.1 helix-turn-helix domain-containing protein [Cryobacterium sp. 10S3]